jgi:hypothetical protein
MALFFIKRRNVNSMVRGSEIYVSACMHRHATDRLLTMIDGFHHVQLAPLTEHFAYLVHVSDQPLAAADAALALSASGFLQRPHTHAVFVLLPASS